MPYKTSLLSSDAVKFFIKICIFFYMAVSYSGESSNPHYIPQKTDSSAEQCLTCHKILSKENNFSNGMYQIPDMSKYKKDGVTMCIQCHVNERVSHLVGVTPEYIVPADLPLDENKRITCLTCHYIHGDLKSEKPMASASVMDYLFNRSRLNKSYVLRRNNAEGDLCLACHAQ